MDEQITDELVQYKTGFMAGKNEMLELTKIGKIITLEQIDSDDNSLKKSEWYEFGYRDALKYFSEKIEKGEDILTIRVKDVIKEAFIKRVVKYNYDNQSEIPISTFRISK